MKKRNYGIIILIISLILTTSIEARGGRGGGGRSSGHSSGHSSSGHSSSGHSSSGHSSSGHSSSGYSSSGHSSNSGSHGGGSSHNYGDSGSHSYGSSGSPNYGDSGSHSHGSSGSHNYGDSSSNIYGNSGSHYNSDSGSSGYSSIGSLGSGSSNSESNRQFWNSLFHGSDGSKSSSSHSSPSDTSLYPSLYGNSHSSKPIIDSDTMDFLNGYKSSNVLSIGMPTNRAPYNHYNWRSHSNNYGSGDELPKTSESELANTETPIKLTTEYNSEYMDIINAINKPGNTIESYQEIIESLNNFDYSKLFHQKNVHMPTVTETPESTVATTESTSTSSKVSSTTTETTVTKIDTTAFSENPKTHDASKSSDDNLLQTVAAVGVGNPEISAPYGMICAPVFYEEINEFNIKVEVEKLACYPAPQPVENKV